MIKILKTFDVCATVMQSAVCALINENNRVLPQSYISGLVCLTRLKQLTGRPAFEVLTRIFDRRQLDRRRTPRKGEEAQGYKK